MKHYQQKANAIQSSYRPTPTLAFYIVNTFPFRQLYTRYNFLSNINVSDKLEIKLYASEYLLTVVICKTKFKLQ